MPARHNAIITTNPVNLPTELIRDLLCILFL
jgi:hypothetical protein